MKKIAVLALAVMAGVAAMAQEKVEATISADFVNQYIWRGQDLGSTAVQPTLGIGYKGLSLTAWGSHGLTNPDDVKEIDLTLDYTIGGLSIGITDYWTDDGLDPEARYFRYDSHCTNHVFEGYIGYDFGPVAVQWYTNFAGNDGTTDDDKRAYSSYVELSAPFHFATVDWTATAGILPR